MKSGLVFYVSDLKKMSNFYREVFGLQQREADEEFVALTNEQFELVLLRTATSKRMSNEAVKESSPRQDTAVKPVFFVAEPIQSIRDKIVSLEGGFKPSNKEWEFNGARVCDGWDPEGNIFQVRSSMRQSD
ncbi:MAG TPA: VOC family protein [candidate division Zixibacteria bacterium]|nr:VOC family protein [candidate division Zixibacteria bacterium]